MKEIKEIEFLIKKVAEESAATRRNVFVVGGFIRDLILGRQTNDIDFVVDKNTAAFAKNISNRLRGSIIKLDELNGIYRVIVKTGSVSYNLDFSQMQGENIETDLFRRDFTVNAIAAKLETSNKWALPCCRRTASPKFKWALSLFIDPFGGIKDIKRKIIRAVAEKNFIDDPLRLLRAYRFNARLGFKIEKRTANLIKKHLRLISKPARERVRDELVKIFSSGRAPEIIEEMDSSGLLEELFPEVMKMKKSARKYYYHPKGLLQHSIETLYRANEIITQPSKFFPEVKERFSARISGREWLLKFVSFLHDLAKPYTARRIGGKVRFFGHETLGGKNIAKIMERLRFSVKEMRYAKHLIENHMRPGNLSNVGSPPTPKAKYRFFRDIGDESADLLVLALADRLSYLRISKKPGEIRKFRKFTNKMIKSYFIHIEKISKPRIVDGYKIMKYLGIPPGKTVGALLKIVEQAHHLGKIETPGQALILAKKRLPAVLKRFG